MTGQRTTGQELKLGVWPRTELPVSPGAVNGAAADASEERRVEAAYFDTPDLRLRRRGVTVRFRRGDGASGIWTATLPEDAPAIRLDQREISMSGGLSEMPALMEDLVRGWALGAPLARVASVTPGQPALAPWDLAAPAIIAAPSAGALVHAALAASAASLVDHVAAVVLDENPEGVHQARVGIRRLRSDLKTARSLLHFKSVRSLRRELDWLMDKLGEVRDLDVLLARMRKAARSLNPSDRPGADAVLTLARQDRGEAYGRLLDALRTARCAALLEETARLAAAPPFKAAAGRPAAEVLPRLVLGPLKDLKHEVRKQGRIPGDEGLHRIRIAVKRVRYAAELAAPAAGRKAGRAARGLADVQRVLGEHNDACVAGVRLRDLGARAGQPGAWAAGLFGGLQLARAARCRRRFPAVWAQAAGKKHWRWTKR